jgi:hypothetical protein
MRALLVVVAIIGRTGVGLKAGGPRRLFPGIGSARIRLSAPAGPPAFALRVAAISPTGCRRTRW